ncbi:MAG: zf-TFIIB domain-containing protein [Burkholderiales bacterium]|nr:zf-TFIIB domain-containing protein [Burkholderiales bacterium]
MSWAQPASSTTAKTGAVKARALTCTHCKGELQPITLEGHYGQQHETDLCPTCHLVWFDAFESVRLSGLGWIGLLRQMHSVMGGPPPGALTLPLACVRCSAELKPVHMLTRFGRSAGHECPNRHGHYQSFSLLLAERGLVRPLSARDRRTLQTEERPLTCLNCGAPVPPGNSEGCDHCASPLVVFDLQRLMASVMVRHGLPLPADDASHVSWPCRGCGDALDPTAMTACKRCGHAVLAPSLADAMPLLLALEPRLRSFRAPGARPTGEALRRQRGFRDTAFFRHVLRPLNFRAPGQDGFEWRDWRDWLPSLAVLAALLWFWLR